MLAPYTPMAEPLRKLPDGTVKQINPFSGTEVWTVPGRGNRPLRTTAPDPRPLDPDQRGRHCSFCEGRYRDSPPEKSRLTLVEGRWITVDRVCADELDESVAEFRRVPNLFEIVSFNYWKANYDFEVPAVFEAHRAAYLACPVGREHLLEVVRTRLLATGMNKTAWQSLPLTTKLDHAHEFFGGGHDVIIARRHFIDGATHEHQLASSGTLTSEEHAQYTMFTIEALRCLYDSNRYARYVAVFQNWLKPAGASFDHLHKQLVAIDERGVQVELEVQRLRTNQNMYNEWAVDYASYHNLVVAENDYAVAFAGFGHRYPTLEVYSKSQRCRPWEHTPQEQRSMSDLLHALHAATGADVPCNEEWQHQPIDLDVPMPWRIVLKWRVSTLAGFEGGTKVYLNTIDPWSLRDRVVPKLQKLRSRGLIARDTRIATECLCQPNSLRYNPALR